MTMEDRKTRKTVAISVPSAGSPKEEIDKQARQEHLAHEAERIHAEEAARWPRAEKPPSEAPLVEVLG